VELTYGEAKVPKKKKKKKKKKKEKKKKKKTKHEEPLGKTRITGEEEETNSKNHKTQCPSYSYVQS